MYFPTEFVYFSPNFSSFVPQSIPNCWFVGQATQSRAEVPQIPLQREQPQKKSIHNFYDLFEEKLRNRRPTFLKKVWKQEEDQLLLTLSEMGHTWEQISSRIPKTNAEICKRRFVRLGEKEPKWTKDDDELIKKLKEDQKKSWIDISNQVPGHTIKQIRERYENYLRDGINLEAWGIEEDMQIVKFVRNFGKKWKKLSGLMPDRTQIQLKNRYYGTLQPIETQIESQSVA